MGHGVMGSLDAVHLDIGALVPSSDQVSLLHNVVASGWDSGVQAGHVAVEMGHIGATAVMQGAAYGEQGILLAGQAVHSAASAAAPMLNAGLHASVAAVNAGGVKAGELAGHAFREVLANCL